MRILMIAPQPFLEPRGTPISVYQRTQGLAALGHTIDLLTYHVGQDIDIPGVTHYRIPRVPFIKQVKVGPSWYKPLLDLLLLGLTIRRLLTQRYDVIHSHEEAAFWAAPLAKLFRTKHLYDMHSSLPKQLANFNFGNVWPIVKLFETLENAVIKSCDALITIGSDLEEHARTIKPSVKQVMIENLPMQHTGAEMDDGLVEQLRAQLNLAGKVPIVYTGTFERYQGLDLLLESAAIVKQQHPEAIFVMVGGKPHQVEQWKAEARRLNLGESMIFTGIVPVDKVRAYMELADILVSPRTEGLSVPLKIYTYLHSGKPIVATRLLAHTLVLNDETAVLAEPNKDAYAEGILKLLRDPALRERVGAAAQKLAAEQYDPANYKTKLERIYREVQPAHMQREQPLLEQAAEK